MDRARLGRLDRDALIDQILRIEERMAQLEAEVAALQSAVSPPSPGRSLLTERQHEIAVLVGRGLLNAEIAARLGLTPGTVANYVAQIMKRLGVRGRVEVAIWAVKQGLADS
jgi:two-component system nitrate/nitrite response regulator NarL